MTMPIPLLTYASDRGSFLVSIRRILGAFGRYWNMVRFRGIRSQSVECRKSTKASRFKVLAIEKDYSRYSLGCGHIRRIGHIYYSSKATKLFGLKYPYMGEYVSFELQVVCVKASWIAQFDSISSRKSGFLAWASNVNLRLDTVNSFNINISTKMPLIQSSQDYLPCKNGFLMDNRNALTFATDIDAVPSEQELDSARALIQAELPQDHKTTLHPSIPERTSIKFSDLVQAEHDRLSSGAEKEQGIDLSRYEAQDAPPTNDTEQWRATLQQAYASSEYLESRQVNLSLLETYGKNAWLISNDQLEAILRAAERDVSQRKIELEDIDRARRDAQAARKGELEALEQQWKIGVGQMIEVEVAAEKLRLEILDKKRAGAR
jgi:pre-mRNA-splicing factor SPF27